MFHEDSYLRPVDGLKFKVGKNFHSLYKCLLCGTEKAVRVSHVVAGSVKSCGCHVRLVPLKDLQGKVFNGVLVLGYLGGSKWRVKFTCGHSGDVTTDTIPKNKTGLCFPCSTSVDKTTRHGNARRSGSTRTYLSWLNMKRRCYDENNNRFDRYGGRGICVCDRWLEDFENFLEDMGPSPEGYTLDRIDFDGDYTPENCKWSTYKEQTNNMSTNILIRYSEQTMSLRHWCECLGLNYKSCHHKMKNKGASAEEVLGAGYEMVSNNW